MIFDTRDQFQIICHVVKRKKYFKAGGKIDKYKEHCNQWKILLLTNNQQRKNTSKKYFKVMLIYDSSKTSVSCQ